MDVSEGANGQPLRVCIRGESLIARCWTCVVCYIKSHATSSVTKIHVQSDRQRKSTSKHQLRFWLFFHIFLDLSIINRRRGTRDHHLVFISCSIIISCARTIARSIPPQCTNRPEIFGYAGKLNCLELASTYDIDICFTIKSHLVYPFNEGSNTYTTGSAISVHDGESDRRRVAAHGCLRARRKSWKLPQSTRRKHCDIGISFRTPTSEGFRV